MTTTLISAAAAMAQNSARRSTGQFGHQLHAEPAQDLLRGIQGPQVDVAYVAEVLAGRDTHQTNDPEVLGVIADRLNESKIFTDEHIYEVSDQVWREHYGYDPETSKNYEDALAILDARGEEKPVLDIRSYVAAVSARPADAASEDEAGTVSLDKPLPDGWGQPVPFDDPRLQAGEVFETVKAEDGTVFHRSAGHITPNMPDQIRLQVNRPITEDESKHLSQLMGYQYAQEVRGEGMGEPRQDTPYSFVINAETSKSRSSDVGEALDRFHTGLGDIFKTGSMPRTTSRNGPVGSQLVPPFADSDLKFELYYDDVNDSY